MAAAAVPSLCAMRSALPLTLLALVAGCGASLRDVDRDGLADRDDACPLLPEDLDGDADDDGCPQSTPLDEDGDRAGAHSACASAPEDRDAFEDGDGCPEADSDGDGFPDVIDRCPSAAEQINGVHDDDGCPEVEPTEGAARARPDGDGDGVPDDLDRCPEEPEDQDGFIDADGCPERGGCVERFSIEAASLRDRASADAAVREAARWIVSQPDARVTLRVAAPTSAGARRTARALVDALAREGVPSAAPRVELAKAPAAIRIIVRASPRACPRS